MKKLILILCIACPLLLLGQLNRFPHIDDILGYSRNKINFVTGCPLTYDKNRKSFRCLDVLDYFSEPAHTLPIGRGEAVTIDDTGGSKLAVFGDAPAGLQYLGFTITLPEYNTSINKVGVSWYSVDTAVHVFRLEWCNTISGQTKCTISGSNVMYKEVTGTNNKRGFFSFNLNTSELPSGSDVTINITRIYNSAIDTSTSDSKIENITYSLTTDEIRG